MSESSTSFSAITSFPMRTNATSNRQEERHDSLMLTVASFFSLVDLKKRVKVQGSPNANLHNMRFGTYFAFLRTHRTYSCTDGSNCMAESWTFMSTSRTQSANLPKNLPRTLFVFSRSIVIPVWLLPLHSATARKGGQHFYATPLKWSDVNKKSLLDHDFHRLVGIYAI